MRLFQITQKQPHHKTYQRVRECLLETNNLAKESFAEELRQRAGLLARFRLFLFLNSNIIFLVFIVLLMGITYFISNFVNVLWIRVVFVCFLLLLYFALLLFVRITPKLEMDLHERWSDVMNCCMRSENWNNNLKQMKRDINRAILSYRWEGKALDIFVNLLWGGIVIGCLPDPEFQKALITLSPLEIFQANFFGSIYLLFLPFIYIYYLVNFDNPIARMEIIIAQIQFEQ